MAVFMDLPSEVLVHVFSKLDTTDRLILSRTCQALKQVYEDSPILQYEALLHTTAYMDVPNQPPPQVIQTGSPAPSPADDPSTNSYVSPHTGHLRPSIPSVKLAPFPEDPPARTKTVYLSAAEKHKLLKRREDNWDTLSAEKIRKFSVNGQAGIYELQEGILLVCDDYVELRDSLLVRSRPYAVRLIPLPSSTDPDLEEPIVTTKSEKVKFPLSDLTMDPTQDLIVVSEHVSGPIRPFVGNNVNPAPTHRYHLLTLSTFQPHPLAAQHILDFPPTTQHVLQTRQLLQIMGDTLLILVSRFAAHWLLAGLAGGGVSTGNDEEIVCWNWKTGHVLARMSLADSGWFSSLALLTPTSFMIATSSNVSPVMNMEANTLPSAFPPVIRVYSFAPDSEWNVVPQQSLDFEHNDDTTPRPVLIAQLNIPPLASGATIAQFEVRPDPAFPPIPRGDQPTLGPRKPFTQDPYRGVLVFDLSVGDPPIPGADPNRQIAANHYELFILREYMIDLSTRGEERLRRSRLKVEDPDRLEIWDVANIQSWAEWGEQNSRLLYQSMENRRWVCSCSGYRYVSLIAPYNSPLVVDFNDEDDAIRQDLLMFDFSPIATRRRSRPTNSASKSGEEPQEEPVEVDEKDAVDDGQWSDFTHEPLEVDVVNDKSCIEREGCWEDDIWTGLPYVRIRKEMGIIANGVMMDDQRVMMVATHDTAVRQDITVLCM